MKNYVDNCHNTQFHQAKWNEPIIFELSKEGERGVLVPLAEDAIREKAPAITNLVPPSSYRTEAARLPKISQHKVLRHYLRLSQENLGSDFNVEIGQGTCTMKYIPKANEMLIRDSRMLDIHPLQHESTVQGLLNIIYNMDLVLREISGMDAFSFQPSGGTQALFTMTSIVRARLELLGEETKRNEIITTIFSHPSQAATAAVKGFRIITLYPDEDGFPNIEALKNVVSDRTSGLVVANPEDTGIFNSKIREFTKVVHYAGGLCYYDQANANGLLGVTRARDAGFDMCFFNLHKTFAAPHISGGPATGALGVSSALEPFLPRPTVKWDGNKFYLDHDSDESIGKVRSFHGVPQTVLRSYAWVCALGADGLRKVAETAVLNNNYLLSKVSKIKGVSVPYVKGKRLEQVRYSWALLTEETGITTEDVQRRMCDFGLHYWTSHHPYIVPQPFTLEPTESYSKEDLDEYVSALSAIAREAYESPHVVTNSPGRSTIHKIIDSSLDDPKQWAITWRAYLRKHGEYDR